MEPKSRAMWSRIVERVLAMIGALALLYLAIELLRPLPFYLRNLHSEPDQPKVPRTLVVDGSTKMVKFAMNSTGPPAAGPEFRFHILTDGSVVCEVADGKGGFVRHSEAATPEQIRVLQRVISATDFMSLPTNLTKPMIICPPFSPDQRSLLLGRHASACGPALQGRQIAARGRDARGRHLGSVPIGAMDQDSGRPKTSVIPPLCRIDAG